jgi:ribosomal protein S18 acetylase RimI-like enzyme
MHDMHFGDATRDDAPALLALLCEAGLSSWDDFDPERALARYDTLEQQLPTARVLVLRRCDGQVMATATLVLLPLLGASGAPSAILEDFAVLPVVQRHGLGRHLLNEAMKIARGAGCGKLVMSAESGNEKARAFYERMGFERQGAGFVTELVERSALQPWERESSAA